MDFWSILTSRSPFELAGIAATIALMFGLLLVLVALPPEKAKADD